MEKITIERTNWGLETTNRGLESIWNKKDILHVIFYQLAKYHYLIPLLLGILGNICIVIICFPICDVIKFEINPSVLTKTFPIWSKSHNKNINILKAQSQSETIFGDWKPFKNNEKYFLFHLKSSFRSQDI